jgi:orotidine-5'-phosphate decarboxylase
MLSSIVVPDGETSMVNLTKIRKLFSLLGERRTSLDDEVPYFVRMFLDGKLHDIPNTIAGASRAISSTEVMFFNVHASGGIEAIKSAAKNKGNSKLLVVTVLTSLGDEECVSIYEKKPAEVVIKFAIMAKEAGADGIICSPQELKVLSGIGEFDNFIKVVPGVRPSWAPSNDQKRIMTPYEAILNGADYIVIGRPISEPPAEIGCSERAVSLITEEIIAAENRLLQQQLAPTM